MDIGGEVVWRFKLGGHESLSKSQSEPTGEQSDWLSPVKTLTPPTIIFHMVLLSSSDFDRDRLPLCTGGSNIPSIYRIFLECTISFQIPFQYPIAENSFLFLPVFRLNE